MKCFRKLSYLGRGFGVMVLLCLLAGCGGKNSALSGGDTAGASGNGESSEPIPEISVQYHADDEEKTYSASEFHEIFQEPDGGVEEAAKEEKEVVTMMSVRMPMGLTLLENAVNAFNKGNKRYYVDLHTIDEEGGETRLLAELGAGRGPDIMFDEVLRVTREMLDRGMLLDLAPYMQASGIAEEKYFPCYACLKSGDKVFGIVPGMTVNLTAINEKVLGGAEVPDDIGTLVDLLLAYPERASFEDPDQSEEWIMRYFLWGSENLWGMVDWEGHKCDFSGELFSKILDVTKRYREDGKSGYEPIMYGIHTFIGQYENPEMLKERGMVPINFYFDEGRFPKANVGGHIMFINANTENPDGAWAFLSFLMTKNGQKFCGASPVYKEVLEKDLRIELKRVLEYGRETLYPAHEGDADEIIEAFNCAKTMPERTEIILNIIFEESASFFAGDKSKEEVIKIIQNRVQLYLNEL